MSAQELRDAAKVLRERANNATPGAWIPFGSNVGVTVDRCTCSPITDPYEMHENYCGVDGPAIQASDVDVSYIVTVYPRVGLALADLLDTLADDREVNAEIDGRTWDHNIVPLARLILGGA